MQDNMKICRRGADPPKNELGMTGAVSPCDESRRSVNSGNDTCIAAKTFSNCQSARPRRKTSHTRLLCPSAAMVLSVLDEVILPSTMRGKAGQTSNVSLAGVQQSCRLRRRGDPRTRHLHQQLPGLYSRFATIP
jgi:hypothetical protein